MINSELESINTALSTDLEYDQMNQKIFDSWKRCRQMSLDQALKIFPGPKIKKELNDKEIPDIFLFYRESIVRDLLFELYETIKRKNGIVFLLQGDLKVYQQRGDQEQLDYLNSMNLGIGNYLTEENIGTSSIVLTCLSKQPEIVRGSEHYVNVLCSYVSYSHYHVDTDGYFFLIIPEENYDSELITLINFYRNYRNRIVEIYKKNLELSMKNKLLELSIKNRDESILYLNSYGQILNVNYYFQELFGYKKCEIEGTHYLDILPELSALEACFIQKHPVSIRKVHFTKLSLEHEHMIVEAAPLIAENIVTGVSVCIYNSKEKEKRGKSQSSLKAKHTFQTLIGESLKFKEVKKIAYKSAKCASSVIITGESGTGKELFAQAIHNESIRADGPFVALNCAALPKDLIASELFGYDDGAFTGAKKGGSMGKFEFANNGTLFLDEIGELPLSVQAILLRVLEEREVTRIGSNQVIPINVRLIAATNRTLEQLVKEGKFRLDLYYRLNVLEIELPSLHERFGDTPLLANSFLQHYTEFSNRNVTSISPQAMKALECYHWPGNIRELKNVIERAVDLADTDQIQVEDLPCKIVKALVEPDSFDDLLEKGDFREIEKENLIKLMVKYNGNKTKIATSLGVARGTLYKKLDEYNII